MLQDAMAAEIGEVKAARERVIGTGPDCLEEQKPGVAVLDVESVKHAILENAQGNFLAISGEIAVVGQSIETWARPACYDRGQLASGLKSHLPIEHTVSRTRGNPLLRLPGGPRLHELRKRGHRGNGADNCG